MNNDGRYDSAEDLIADINEGNEIEFSYNGKMYSITYWEDSICIIEFYQDDTEKLYKTAEELVNDYTLQGHVLKDIIQDIEVVFIT